MYLWQHWPQHTLTQLKHLPIKNQDQRWQQILILQKLHHVLIYVYLSHFFVSFDLVPPDIEPFSFGDLSIRTLSGTRTRVICGLTRGDLPVTFHWLKDGIPLHHHYSLLLRANTPDSEPVEPTISSVDLFSSLLTINKLTQGECS